MNDKDLKRLRRSRLLEILTEESKVNKELKSENEVILYRLSARTITIKNAGSLAEASLKLNGVFEAAEAAAQQYMESIKQM